MQEIGPGFSLLHNESLLSKVYRRQGYKGLIVISLGAMSLRMALYMGISCDLSKCFRSTFRHFAAKNFRKVNLPMGIAILITRKNHENY